MELYIYWNIIYIFIKRWLQALSGTLWILWSVNLCRFSPIWKKIQQQQIRNFRKYQKVKVRFSTVNTEVGPSLISICVDFWHRQTDSSPCLFGLFIFLPVTSVHLILPAKAICSITCKIFRVHFQLHLLKGVASSNKSYLDRTKYVRIYFIFNI